MTTLSLLAYYFLMATSWVGSNLTRTYSTICAISYALVTIRFARSRFARARG